MKRRIKAERRANRKAMKERKKRLKPYKPKVRRKRRCRWPVIVLLAMVFVVMLGIATVLGINSYVKSRVSDQILTPEKAKSEAR